jgi:hypothetical protein
LGPGTPCSDNSPKPTKLIYRNASLQLSKDTVLPSISSSFYPSISLSLNPSIPKFRDPNPADFTQYSLIYTQLVLSINVNNITIPSGSYRTTEVPTLFGSDQTLTKLHTHPSFVSTGSAKLNSRSYRAVEYPSISGSYRTAEITNSLEELYPSSLVDTQSELSSNVNIDNQELIVTQTKQDYPEELSTTTTTNPNSVIYRTAELYHPELIATQSILILILLNSNVPELGATDSVLYRATELYHLNLTPKSVSYCTADPPTQSLIGTQSNFTSPITATIFTTPTIDLNSMVPEFRSPTSVSHCTAEISLPLVATQSLEPTNVSSMNNIKLLLFNACTDELALRESSDITHNTTTTNNIPADDLELITQLNNSVHKQQPQLQYQPKYQPQLQLQPQPNQQLIKLMNNKINVDCLGI